MPYLHLKRIHTNTAKIPKVTISNVVNGAIVRPFKLVNSSKQRLTALFFIGAIFASMLLAPIAEYSRVYAASNKTIPGLTQQATKNKGADKLASVDAKTKASAANQTKLPTDFSKKDIKKNNTTYTFDTATAKPTSANSSQMQFPDGTIGERVSSEVQNTKQGNEWKKADLSLNKSSTYASQNKQPESLLDRLLPGSNQPQGFDVNPGGKLSAQMQTLLNGQGIKISDGKKTITVAPVGANKVKPEKMSKLGRDYIAYKDVWKGVDVEYDITAETIKESIIIKSNDAANTFSFKISGGELIAGANDTWQVKDSDIKIAPFSVSLWGVGPISNPPTTVTYENGVYSAKLSADWLKQLPKSNFPVVLDPDYYTRTDVGGDYGRFWNAKSDGYTCGSSNCWMNLGSLVQAGAGVRNWHTSFNAPYGHLAGKYLTGAYLHTGIKYGTANWIGYEAPKTVWVTWLPAFNYNYGGGAPVVAGTVGVDGWIDVTPIYSWLQSRGDYGGWLTMWSEENGYSYKLINPSWTFVDFYYADYNAAPSAPGVVTPLAKQVFNDTQPSFQMSPASDPNGDPLKYWFRIMGSNPGSCSTPTNILMDSSDIDSLQWTVPDGVLSDGGKYYLCGYVHDDPSNTYHYIGGPLWNFTQPVEFTVDMRLGKDKTQTYDNVGPVSVALSSGNVTMSTSSNTMSALGGSMGVGLEYNSPYSSRSGLKAKYWDNPSFSGNPVLTRVDGSVDFNWQLGSPSFGVVPIDNFSARWEGYFVAPETGAYQFGGTNDDSMSVWVNNTQVYSAGCCQTNTLGSSSISLTAGQVVPIKIDYVEATSIAYASLKASFNGKTVTVSKDWLRTEPMVTNQTNGLTGKYYKLEANENIIVPTDRAPFLTRLDSAINFNWGLASPIYGGPTDKFAVKWTGYISVPQDTSYQFCTQSDDGVRLSFDNNAYYIDKWIDQGNVQNCGASLNWKAGEFHYVSLEYYDNLDGAAIQLQVNYLGRPTEPVSASWLTPGAKVVPDGWSLGIDPDGSINYETLKVTSSGVNVFDNGGVKHFFEAVAGSASYKPPLNESANLTRNADSSFTLQDTDGRTYEFSSEGRLTRLTTPQDDRQPAAIRYEYAGNPSRIQRIVDGADSSRNMTIYYQGDSNCPAVPGGFDAVPAGMICATKSTDGGYTYFDYKLNNLARIETKGGVITDYAYDSLGRITDVRSPLSNDLITSGQRVSTDATLNTQVSYDAIGRASGSKIPAAKAGDIQTSRSYEYTGPSFTAWSAPANLTDQPSGSPNLVNYGEGRLGLFARFGTELRWKKLINGTWSSWESLGSCMWNDPSATSWEPGRIDVFIQGCDGYLYTKSYVNGIWSDYAGLGSTVMTSSPSATSWAPGRIDVVAKGPNNELMQRWYGTATGWSGFGSLGGCLSQGPTVSTWGIDRLNIYLQGCGSPNSFFAKYWQPGWTDFIQFTPEQNITSAFQSITSPQNRNIQVVARGSGGELRYLKFDGNTWDTWQTVQACIIGTPAITTVSDTTYIVYTGCDGNLYQTTRTQLSGTTKVHVSGATEPNGFSQKVEYDNLGRTVRNTSLDNLTISSEWDPFKDMLYAATDATGLKTTTLYNDNDLPTDIYGPAPAEWFGSDRKPLAAYVNQVSHSQTAYDEGLVGPAVAWYNYKSGGTSPSSASMFGSPRYHTTGFGGSSQASWLGRDFRNADSVAPIAADTSVSGVDGYGFSATGKIKFPGAGTYTFKMWNDDGARLFINDNQIFSNWGTVTEGAAQNVQTGTFAAEAGKYYRFRLDYGHTGNPGAIDLWIAGAGIVDTNGGLGTDKPTFIIPDYGLATSTKAFNSQFGDTTNATNFGSRPELGQTASLTQDVGGMNLATSYGYEPYQTGSLMRQTTKTLPGGNTYTTTYYGAVEARANPCVAGSPAISQAGFAKGTIEPDPDGAGPLTSRTSESVYDASGSIVASRINNDSWTCSTYDDRGRTVATVIPTINGRLGRTVSNNYIVNGNPLISSQTDSTLGTSTVEIDVLGRTVRAVDVYGNVSTITRDNLGRTTAQTGMKGNEAYTYDIYNRVSSYKLDNTTYANITYDTYGRIASVEYPPALLGTNKLTLSQVKRDTLQRVVGSTFTLSSGATLDETVTLANQSSIVTGYADTFGGKTAGGAFTYDKAGRLISAKVDTTQFDYGFGAQATSCSSNAAYNANAYKNGNRTSYKVTNLVTSTSTTTQNCYGQADQLVSSTDTQIGVPIYDDHGNITQLSGNGTPLKFTYDASDQNTVISQGTNKVEYTKTTSGTVLVKKEYRSGKLNKVYRTVGGVLQTCDLVNQNLCSTSERYVNLPGGVILTLSTTSKVYSLTNFHGDTVLTVAANGAANSKLFMYDPFGQTINSTTFASSGTPANTISGGMGWAAAPERKAEIMFSIPIVQMGARVYLPTLGRFLQIDPIQGGTESAYAYANDPINSSDYSGTKLWGWIATIVAVVVVVAVVACFVTGACEVGAGLVAVGTAIVEAVSTVAVVVRTFGSSISASASRAAGPVVNAGSRVVTSANKFLSSASRPATSVASKVPKIPGTYQFRTTSGEMYSGMSTRSISARISAHMADGKLGPDTVVTYWDRSGASKLDIRIAEQRLINGTGGVGNPDVANKINSIRQSYWDELGL